MRKSPSLKNRTKTYPTAIIRIVINRPAGVDPGGGGGAGLAARNPLVNCHRQANGKV